MHTKLERLLSKSLTTLEVMTDYLVVHTGPGPGAFRKFLKPLSISALPNYRPVVVCAVLASPSLGYPQCIIKVTFRYQTDSDCLASEFSDLLFCQFCCRYLCCAPADGLRGLVLCCRYLCCTPADGLRGLVLCCRYLCCGPADGLRGLVLRHLL